MKRLKICSVLLVLALLLTACAGRNNQDPASDRSHTGNAGDTLPAPVAPGGNSETGPSPAGNSDTEPSAKSDTGDGNDADTDSDVPDVSAPEFTVSASFSALFPTCPDSVTAVLANTPFPNGKPDASLQWNDGAYDQLVLVPRFVGSTVNAYRLNYTEADGLQLENDPVYSAEATDGTAIFASLDRPEGFPAWYVEIVTPDGKRSGMTLEFNGRTGTPAYEYICMEPAEEDELVKAVTDAHIVPLTAADLNAFVLAARKCGMEPWEAAERCFTQLTDIGDGAAFTLSYGHEMAGNVYSFRMARMHQFYLIEAYGIDELVTGQYSIYEQMGNELGILGPSFTGELPDLTWRLSGLTVFNKLLAAKEIRVSVNGEDIGTYTLPQDQFCTLIPLDLPEQLADTPISVDVTIVSAWYGEPDGAWIDVYGGISSNISGAL